MELSDFALGWHSAVESMQNGLKVLETMGYENRTKPMDVLLDVHNLLKEIEAVIDNDVEVPV